MYLASRICFCSKASDSVLALSPLNPGELLIALHNIDSVKCDMKSIIKGEAVLRPPFSGLVSAAGKNLRHPHTPAGVCRVRDYAPLAPVRAGAPSLASFPLSLPLSVCPSSLHLRNRCTCYALAQSCPQEGWEAPPSPAAARGAKEAEPRA